MEAPVAAPAPAPPTAPETPGSGPFGMLATVAAIPLTCSAFLPWLRLQISDDLFGATVVRQVTLTGFRADGTGTVVAICGLMALGLGGAALALNRPGLHAGTAVAGAGGLVCSLVFLLRTQEIEGFFGSGMAAPSYGWHLALAASLLVLGAGLAELSRRSPGGAAASDPAASPWPP